VALVQLITKFLELLLFNNCFAHFLNLLLQPLGAAPAQLHVAATAELALVELIFCVWLVSFLSSKFFRRLSLLQPIKISAATAIIEVATIDSFVCFFILLDFYD
jgi:hypothetical protein